MRYAILPLVLVLLIATFVPWAPARAAFTNIEYSDPASDVVQLNSTTGLCVVDANGDCVMSSDPSEVNILWLRARNQTSEVELEIEVKSRIATQSNTTYLINFYADETNQTHWIVNYTNGNATLYTNATGAPRTDVSGSVTITGPNPTAPNKIIVAVDKALLGGDGSLAEDVNVQATAIMRGSPYSYQDFGWELPGNPGSSPTMLVGRVTEAGTAAPLAGATVALSTGQSVLTNGTGHYQFSLTAGTYNVTFSAEGFVEQTFTVSVTTGQTTTQDAALARPPALSSDLLLPLLLLVAVVGVLGLVLWGKRRKRKAPPT